MKHGQQKVSSRLTTHDSDHAYFQRETSLILKAKHYLICSQIV